jgi:isoleucyl-tRNA synthetase
LKNADEANAKQAVKDAREMLHSYSYLSCILNGNSYFTEEELQQLYTAANRRNLWERITQTNKNDVIEFHHALMDKTYEQCKDIFYSCLESFMHDEIN